MKRVFSLILALKVVVVAAYAQVLEFTDAIFDSFFTNDDHPPLLLEVYAPWCGHCKNLAPAYDLVPHSISQQYSGEVMVAKLDGTANQKVKALLNTSGYPSIFMFRKGSHRAEYAPQTIADLSTAAIVEWTIKQITETDNTSGDGLVFGDREVAANEGDDGDESSGPVESLSPDQWVTTVDEPNYDTFILYTNPDNQYCHLFSHEYEQVASGLRGISGMRFFTLDVAEHADHERVKRLQLPSPLPYPIVMRYKSYSNQPYVESYHGGRNALDLFNYILEKNTELASLIDSTIERAVVKGEVIELTPETMRPILFHPSLEVMVKFYAPWCGHCKKMAPAYSETARLVREYKSDESGSHVLFAQIDVEKYPDVGTEFNVVGYPTLQFYRNTNGGGIKDAMIYNLGRSTESFLQYLNLQNIHKVDQSTQRSFLDRGEKEEKEL